MGFTDGGIIEPLILLVFLAGVMACCIWLTVAGLRVLAARRRQVDAPRNALRQAKSALADLISEPAVFGPVREAALTAYDTVSEALKKETR